jgi:ribosome-associated protein
LSPRSAVPARNRVVPPIVPCDDLRRTVAAALEELKAREVREIDVRGKTGITDWMVIASGTSSRHVKAIADEVLKQSKLIGCAPLGVEGEREGEWVLVDLGDMIIHVMLPRVREFYGLERLWSVGDDAPAGDDAGERMTDIEHDSDERGHPAL